MHQVDQTCEKREISIDKEKDRGGAQFSAPKKFDFIIEGEQVFVTKSCFEQEKVNWSEFAKKRAAGAPTAARMQYLRIKLDPVLSEIIASRFI